MSTSLSDDEPRPNERDTGGEVKLYAMWQSERRGQQDKAPVYVAAENMIEAMQKLLSNGKIVSTIEGSAIRMEEMGEFVT